MSNNLPSTTKDETFLAAAAKVDLNHLKDKTFLVAVSSGDRAKNGYLLSSLRGPYDFYSMVNRANNILKTALHSKILIVNPDPKEQLLYLDENTTDYIEQNAEEIVGSFFEEQINDSKNYTHTAGVLTVSAEKQE